MNRKATPLGGGALATFRPGLFAASPGRKRRAEYTTYLVTQAPWKIEAETSAEAHALQAAQAGDAEPLGLVLEGYRDRLRRMLQLRLAPVLMGRVAVSDVLQEAYIEATRRLPGYLDEQASAPRENRQGMPLYLWVRYLAGQQLARAYRFHLGTMARDAGRDQAMVIGGVPGASSVHLAAALAESGVSPSGAASSKEVREILADALESLDETDREILMLRHFEQMPNKDIARLLGLSESGASLRHLRAMDRMQAALAARGLTLPGSLPEA